MTEMKLHPVCAVFPAMPEKDLADLAADIKANGLLDPITIMPDGTILDGRNRWLACQRVGVEPMTTVYNGDDVIAFVVSRNLKRRNLTYGQRSLIAARLANLSHGSNQHATKNVEGPLDHSTFKPVTQTQAAELVGVHAHAPSDARALLKGGAPHVIAMVERGEIDIKPAVIVARHASKSEQAAWKTPAEVRAAARTNHRYNARNIPAKPRQPKRPQLLAYTPRGRWLTPEERELPSPEEACEQAPGYPEGVNKMQAHIREHGHVQLWSPTETRQLELGEQFTQFCGFVRRLAKHPWPSPADIDGQKPERAREVRQCLTRDLGPAIARLTAFRDALAQNNRPKTSPLAAGTSRP